MEANCVRYTAIDASNPDIEETVKNIGDEFHKSFCKMIKDSFMKIIAIHIDDEDMPEVYNATDNWQFYIEETREKLTYLLDTVKNSKCTIRQLSRKDEDGEPIIYARLELEELDKCI